jgi:hypothetical protein
VGGIRDARTAGMNNIQARGDDGSVLRVPEVARAVVNADPTMKILFDRMSCESG